LRLFQIDVPVFISVGSFHNLPCEADGHPPNPASEFAEQRSVHFIADTWDYQFPDSFHVSVTDAIFLLFIIVKMYYNSILIFLICILILYLQYVGLRFIQTQKSIVVGVYVLKKIFFVFSCQAKIKY
jgi:hypothetical protein